MALIADLRAKPPPVFGGFGSHQSFTPAEPAVRHVHGEGRPSVPRNKYISIVYSLRAQLRLNVELKMEDILGLFDNLPVEFVPRARPTAGTQYIYRWEDTSRKG